MLFTAGSNIDLAFYPVTFKQSHLDACFPASHSHLLSAQMTNNIFTHTTAAPMRLMSEIAPPVFSHSKTLKKVPYYSLIALMCLVRGLNLAGPPDHISLPSFHFTWQPE